MVVQEKERSKKGGESRSQETWGQRIFPVGEDNIMSRV